MNEGWQRLVTIHLNPKNSWQAELTRACHTLAAVPTNAGRIHMSRQKLEWCLTTFFISCLASTHFTRQPDHYFLQFKHFHEYCTETTKPSHLQMTTTAHQQKVLERAEQTESKQRRSKGWSKRSVSAPADITIIIIIIMTIMIIMNENWPLAVWLSFSWLDLIGWLSLTSYNNKS